MCVAAAAWLIYYVFVWDTRGSAFSRGISIPPLALLCEIVKRSRPQLSWEMLESIKESCWYVTQLLKVRDLSIRRASMENSIHQNRPLSVPWEKRGHHEALIKLIITLCVRSKIFQHLFSAILECHLHIPFKLLAFIRAIKIVKMSTFYNFLKGTYNKVEY